MGDATPILTPAKPSDRAPSVMFRTDYIVSTPTLQDHSRIKAAFEHGDRRFYHVPCLHCGDMAPITLARIRWPEG